MPYIDKFEEALCFLNPEIRAIFFSLPDKIKDTITEIRIKVNKPIVIVSRNECFFIGTDGKIRYIYSDLLLKTDRHSVEDCFHRLCNYSVYSCQTSINNGFITISGGHRIGLCGTAVCQQGQIVNVKDINSINIRIAREFAFVADSIFDQVFNGEVENLIIAGAPSSGKTTLLRDLARQLSDGTLGKYYKVCIVDERNEIAAASESVLNCNVGFNTDVLTHYPKAVGIMTAIRCMSPDVIICDEIGDDSETRAIESGLHSGVKFILSVHASSEEEVCSKLQIKSLVQTHAFDKVVLLHGADKPCVIKNIFRKDDVCCENNFTYSDLDDNCACRKVC